MNWEAELSIRLEAVGGNPTDAQLSNLESWILNNVPYAYWGNISSWLPGRLATEFSMRHGEGL